MITKFARLEFELFTKPSKSDFLRVHLICYSKEVVCQGLWWYRGGDWGLGIEELGD